MLSTRPHIDRNAPSAHHNLSIKTPAKPSAYNTLGVNTILRTNLKENTANRAALLKTAPRTHVVPGTPSVRKPTISTPAFNPLKVHGLLGTETMKMPRLLDLTNKTPFASHHISKSPNTSNVESPLKAPFQSATATLADVPDTILRSSRARTSFRMPRMSGSSANAVPPVTPAPEGRRKHWEVLSDGGDISTGNISNDDLEWPSIDLEAEIEYMPPPAVELPYDPGFDMPDYKDIGANIWKIGNIFDISTLADIQPPELPFLIQPDDIPSFDSIVQFEPYTRPEEDLETFIGSQNLYTRFEKPSASALPSLQLSTNQHPQPTQRSKAQTALPLPPRTHPSSQRPAAAKSARKPDGTKITKNAPVPSASTPVPAPSSATTRFAAERTSRQPTSNSTAQAAAAKLAVKASKTRTTQVSRLTKKPAAAPPTRVTRSATAAARAARSSPAVAVQSRLTVNRADDDVVSELMIPQNNVLDEFDLQLTEI